MENNDPLKPTADDQLQEDPQEQQKAEEPSIGYHQEYTYADYLTWEFDHMVELIRGKVFKMSPAPTSFHQQVLGNLHVYVGNYLKKKKCKVYLAPFDVVLPVQNRKKKEACNTVVQPDLCVICDLRLIDKAGCFGAPDWVVEILSPHTSKKDLQLKYDVYEEAGVKEYWIVMPSEQLVEVFLLEDGKFRRVQTYAEDDLVVPATLPELKIELSELFDF